MSRTVELLEKLVAFASVSTAPNAPIADWIATYLTGLGFDLHRLPGPDGKVGLLARLGPGAGGVMLSAHMDVVPAEGQAWTRDPFRLSQSDGRLYGRGTSDMKGFLASALNAAALAAQGKLKRPLILCLSYDEEVGCRGIRAMAPQIVPLVGRPDYCIVGEPTLMRIATGHKGKRAFSAECRGTAGHSASAPRHINALHLAARFVLMLDAEQQRLIRNGAQDGAYDVPSSTLHAGLLSGGIALNIVPDRASVTFEIRPLAEDRPDDILACIHTGAAEIVAATGRAEAEINIHELNAYPGLNTDPAAPVVHSVAALLPGTVALTKVAYGTEAGFFDALGIPTVVCGPGSMDQGHQPDEYIDRAQLDQCDAMLAKLVQGLCT